MNLKPSVLDDSIGSKREGVSDHDVYRVSQFCTGYAFVSGKPGLPIAQGDRVINPQPDVSFFCFKGFKSSNDPGGPKHSTGNQRRAGHEDLLRRNGLRAACPRSLDSVSI